MADDMAHELAGFAAEYADLERTLHPIGGENRKLFLNGEMRLRKSMLVSLEERGIRPHPYSLLRQPNK